jgi:hypothetical protein
MSLQTELEKKIEKKNQEIASLEGQIREAKAFVSGLLEALRSVQKDSDRSIAMPRAKQFRGNSDMAKSHEFIKQMGKPQHINDIVTLGLKKPATKSNLKSVAGALNNYAREGRVFKRTDTNTFSLLEFENQDLDLPDDFGIDDENLAEQQVS